MADSANDSPLTPSNDNNVFRCIEMVLFEMVRVRREMLDVDVSILPFDKQRKYWDAFQGLDEMIRRSVTYIGSQPDWFKHML